MFYNSFCLLCFDCLFSCVGFLNGKNLFFGRVWFLYYVDCLNNRIYIVYRCINGWFYFV